LLPSASQHAAQPFRSSLRRRFLLSHSHLEECPTHHFHHHTSVLVTNHVSAAIASCTLRPTAQPNIAAQRLTRRCRETFDNIYLDLSKQTGKCRFAESGLGWKPSGPGDTFTLDKAEIISSQWSRAARGFEVKIYSRNSGVIQLDGFMLDV